MTKGKSFFGRDKDENKDENKDEGQADVNEAAAPSPAPGELPQAGQPRTASGGKLPVPHGETNPETVGTTEVNPHNEAAAQRPATLPNTAVHGHIQGRPITELEKLSGDDRLAHLRGWGREGKMRGHITSADWELFEKIVGEDPEEKKVREAQAEAQRKALEGPRDQGAQGDVRADGLTEAEREAARASRRDRP